MKLFVVTFRHDNLAGWAEHLDAHIQYLHKLVAEGTLVVSGPFVGTQPKSAMLILSVADRESALKVIAEDPYSITGQVSASTVTEWLPKFGSIGTPTKAAVAKQG